MDGLLSKLRKRPKTVTTDDGFGVVRWQIRPVTLADIAEYGGAQAGVAMGVARARLEAALDLAEGEEPSQATRDRQQAEFLQAVTENPEVVIAPYQVKAAIFCAGVRRVWVSDDVGWEDAAFVTDWSATRTTEDEDGVQVYADGSPLHYSEIPQETRDAVVDAIEALGRGRFAAGFPEAAAPDTPQAGEGVQPDAA